MVKIIGGVKVQIEGGRVVGFHGRGQPVVKEAGVRLADVRRNAAAVAPTSAAFFEQLNRRFA